MIKFKMKVYQSRQAPLALYTTTHPERIKLNKSNVTQKLRARPMESGGSRCGEWECARIGAERGDGVLSAPAAGRRELV